MPKSKKPRKPFSQKVRRVFQFDPIHQRMLRKMYDEMFVEVSLTLPAGTLKHETLCTLLGITYHLKISYMNRYAYTNEERAEIYQYIDQLRDVICDAINVYDSEGRFRFTGDQISFITQAYADLQAFIEDSIQNHPFDFYIEWIVAKRVSVMCFCDDLPNGGLTDVDCKRMIRSAKNLAQRYGYDRAMEMVTKELQSFIEKRRVTDV